MVWVSCRCGYKVKAEGGKLKKKIDSFDPRGKLSSF